MVTALTGYEDDFVIELANEVRKVLGILGIAIAKEKRVCCPSHVPGLQLHPLPDAIVMDSQIDN
ncbi:hypothetical protein RJ641_006363 [Dillenia turbinata]|uniref:Uncharacterized protein n=1 Tax=Dillenia turbinata TaxID=194707 RepID=A0AAN8VEE0_9MAGN